VFTTLLSPASTLAASAGEIDRDAKAALETLFQSTPQARDLARQAKPILVFPSVFRAGLVIGGLYGEGVLMIGGRTVGFDETGLMAGIGLQGSKITKINP
jgi:lipid-binding SYLF domain-containing protein